MLKFFVAVLTLSFTVAAQADLNVNPPWFTLYGRAGQMSAPQDITITNLGDQNAIVSVTQIGCLEFMVMNMCEQLQPQEGCVIEVEFHPTSNISETCTLQVADGVSGSTATVEILGTIQ